ncbi:5'-nucleotidase [Kutzneria buriramensis]|uniref:5'-nucleotidase n=1 Tax=Kutzneria buriramensis TaxID=1045776 RepID=A0A3E0H040_9PSEU|nr:5'-nucleotidase [Kutzneria buriramensis]REH36178.1 5'-nucleotidase [Kutzneria buriramensis]
MGYDLGNHLVIGIASSALFDLTESDAVFRQDGEEAYRRYQEAHRDEPLAPGVAYPFARRLLSLDDVSPVEVIVLSRNDPDTGLRVMESVAHHRLPITRAIFTQGRAPYRFMPALNMSLFLSADDADVRQAVELGLPAGRVLDSTFVDDESDDELRIAFDFDGVLASDESERVMQAHGLDGFQSHEVANAVTPLEPGPLKNFLAAVNRIQRQEEQYRLANPDYRNRVRVSIVTARSAPAHVRAVTSLKRWGVMVNDAFFLGGVGKAGILDVLKPHIFFDDQPLNLTSREVPSVHVPFGVINEAGPD